MTSANGRQRTTHMADPRDERALRRDPDLENAVGGRTVPAGSLHARGAGSDVAPLGGGAPGGPGPALHGDRREDERLADEGDAGGALAPPRRGRLSAGVGAGKADDGRLTIAVPVKGRL